MTKEEVDRFLEMKLNLQLATIDDQGWPNIHPVWFFYDKADDRLLLTTGKLAKKSQNLRKKPFVYFSIDDENSVPKGVKGRGIVKIIEDPTKTVSAADKMSIKYLGTLDHPVAKMITEGAKRERSCLLKLVRSSFPHGIIAKRNSRVWGPARN